MKKIKIEHLAPYLPYGLKFIDRYEQKQGQKLLTGICSNIIYYDDEQKWTSLDCLIPIFRPIKDLTQDLVGHQIDLVLLKKEFELFNDYNVVTNFLPVHIYNSLLKHHFDVFGLIEQGLAIDINTQPTTNK